LLHRKQPLKQNLSKHPPQHSEHDSLHFKRISLHRSLVQHCFLQPHRGLQHDKVHELHSLSQSRSTLRPTRGFGFQLSDWKWLHHGAHTYECLAKTGWANSLRGTQRCGERWRQSVETIGIPTMTATQKAFKKTSSFHMLLCFCLHFYRER